MSIFKKGIKPFIYLDKDIKVRNHLGRNMYTKVTYDCGEVKEIQKYIPGNYGAPGCPRDKKRKRTPEEVKRQNEVNKKRRVQRLILANFDEGDFHVALTYKKDLRPPTTEEANSCRQKFLAEMRKAYKKAGKEFKYIGVTEIGSRGAVHHHIVINNPEGLDTTRIIQKAWTQGRPFITPLYPEGEYEQLADYIMKGGGEEGTSYTRSRNLKVPEPKREVIRSMRWKDPPPVPKGWEIIKETLFNGHNPVTGYPYQRYMIRRSNDSQHLHPPNNQRPEAAAGIRDLHPGGSDRERTGDNDLQRRAGRERERSKLKNPLVGGQPHDALF